jgi:outer membrane protein assembly factor BamA
MLLLSLEYKRRIVSFHLFSVVELSLEGCLFFDVGRTWDNGEDVTFQDLDTAWGIGGRIRVTSSVSLEVRLEWGFGVRGSGFYWKAF